VVRNVAPDGMGVAIVSMEQEDRGRLDQWLKQLGTRGRSGGEAHVKGWGDMRLFCN